MGDSVLTSYGFKYYSAGSGAEALKMLEEVKPDLILLDIIMPGMDGFEACERIKSNPACRETPIIMLTGNDDHESVKTAYDNGAWDFTAKPINWPILANRCTHALDASSAFGEARRAARLSRILDNSYNDIITIDPETLLVLDANENSASRESLTAVSVGNSILDLLVGYDAQSFQGLVSPLQEGEPQTSFSGELRRPDGSTCPCEGLILKSTDDLEKDVYVVILRDISERLQKEREVYQLQYFDMLTGLPNRFLFSERVEQAIAIAKRSEEPFALMLLDLDSFKLANDALGHKGGDEILTEVASRLKDLVDRYGAEDASRGADIQIARPGGDEFLLLITGFDDHAVVTMIAEDLLEQLREPFVGGGHEVTITGSIGVCLYPQDGRELEELMKNVDTAMYDAKAQGKNTFKFYNDDDSDASLQILTTETQLRQAIDRNELFLHYQVQVDNVTGRICGLEALVRWNHPERGIIPPGDFIPVAEATSLIIDLGNYVIEQVFQDSQSWLTDVVEPDCEIAINISTKQLRHENFAEKLKACAEKYKPAHKIVIEITESSIMEDTGSQMALLQGVRDMGMDVAIDDFGTGYSSLSYLKNLPVDCLKVDQSFVRNIESNKTDFAIVKVIFNLAQMLGLRVVAEGVETKEQAALLSECGAHFVQGYLVSRPLSASDLTEFVGNQVQLAS